AFTVNDGAALAASGSGSITLPMAGLTLGTAGATTLTLNNVSGTNAPITATNLTANGTVTVRVLSGLSGLYKLGNSPLIKYTGAINGAGFSSFALGALPIGVSGYLTNNTAAQTVDVVITGIPTVIWTGTAGQAWDIGGTLNWQIGGTNVPYLDGESVRFDDSAPGNVNVQFNTVVRPSALTVSNTTLAYTFSPNGGSLAGNGTFTKSGTGALLISPPTAVGFNNSAFTGTVIINGGAINTSANAGAFNANEGVNPLGIGPLIISNNASLNYNGGQVQTGGAVLTTNYQAITLAGGNIFSFETERHFVGPINVVAGTINSLTSNGANGTAGNAAKIVVVDGVVSGSGNLTIPIPATTHRNPIRFMNPANTFSGTLRLNNGSAYLDSGTTMASATVNFATATATINGFPQLSWNNAITTLVLGGLSGLWDMNLGSVTEFHVGGNNSSTLYSGALGGAATVIKEGTGTLTLSGANANSGLTTVSNGTLVISTAHMGNGDFVVNDGKTLGVINNEGGQSAQMNNLTLGHAAGPTTLVITNLTDPLTPVITAAAAVTLTGNCILTIPTADSVVPGSVYPLVKYGSLGGAGSFLLSVPASVTATLTNDTSNLWIALNVTAVQTVNTNPTNITATVSGDTLSLTWPGDHLGWTLQTNSVSLADPGQWFVYPGSALVTNVNITLDASKTNVFFRLVYP
ncbi:MAG: autotransporter-associated beta strand repeat-containing protein, partial [Akkermansiaceae bacterium]|nr:autotransporter-associated beta strand repeat-containing protein [Verrucomicrobiales bacterium]